MEKFNEIAEFGKALMLIDNTQNALDRIVIESKRLRNTHIFCKLCEW